MGMREEVLKLAEECGAQSKAADGTGEPYIIYRGEIVTNLLERFYQAATIQAAERMKEEATKVCKETAWLYKKKEGQKADRFFIGQGARELQAAAIRAIDVNKLFGE